MNICLIAGHGAGDPGACGCGYEEADLTREVVEILADKLQGYADIDVYPMDHSAYHDLSVGDLQVNWTNYDYVLEVHFNAGGGEGTEIYVTRIEEATDAEETIMDEMGEYFNIRGVKRMNFNVIYSAKRAGVSSALLEVCFIDSDDMDIYEENKDGVIQSIANGIIKGFGLGGDTPTPEPPQPKPEPTPDPQPEPMPRRTYIY
jgi:N-acetylmuramoyl-L-alanine amidase